MTVVVLRCVVQTSRPGSVLVETGDIVICDSVRLLSLARDSHIPLRARMRRISDSWIVALTTMLLRRRHSLP